MNSAHTGPCALHTVDRAARDRMADALEGFLNRGMTNFQLDEILWDVAGQSSDFTVEFVAREVWFCYDDLAEHTVCLSKTEWDLFYRFILLLRSDGQVEVSETKHWSITQGIAAVSLASFILLVCWQGTDGFLLAYPLGMVMFVLLFLRHLQEPPVDNRLLAMAPFSSLAELRAARQSVARFQKNRYPDYLKEKRIRSRLFEWLCAPIQVLFALQVSPLLLPCFLFPYRLAKTRVVFSA